MDRTTKVLLTVIAFALVILAARPVPVAVPALAAPFAAAPAVSVAPGRYQLVRVNDNNIFIIDTQTGRCSQRFVASDSGPSQWQITDPNFAKP